jgi:hypothetical protein
VFCVLGLLVNDHVLKWHSNLPGWFTGKLSDFFGLIVAPLTLCLLVRARSPRARALCFAVPTALFVATELSLKCADLVSGLFAATGLSWKLWADPTDLIALSVLPLAWRMALWMGDKVIQSDKVIQTLRWL